MNRQPVINKQLADAAGALSRIERIFMTRRTKERIYIAHEEVNFIWDMSDVREFRFMWRKGKSLEYISEYFERPEIDIFQLMTDQLENGKVKGRKGGIYGFEQTGK